MSVTDLCTCAHKFVTDTVHYMHMSEYLNPWVILVYSRLHGIMYTLTDVL